MITNIKKTALISLLALIAIFSNFNNIAESKSWDFETEETIKTEVTPLQAPKLKNADDLINLSLRDTDVKQILRMFADRLGLNIVFMGSIKGSVTLDLVDTTVQSAIEIVAESAGLTYVIDNNTMIVMTIANAKKSNFAKTAMRTIPVKYMSASDVATFLNKEIFGLGKPGISTGNIVSTNPAKNELVIFGTDNDYKMALNVLKKLDSKPTSTTYKINHVTPEEMAALVCESLFSKSKANIDSSTKIANNGYLTGAAGGITIPTSKIACKVAAPKSSVSSFPTKPITIMYNTNLGQLTMLGGSKEQIQLLNEFILLHDKKQPQAILEFAILELKENGTQTFTNDWSFINNTFPVYFTGGMLEMGNVIFFGRNNMPDSIVANSNRAGAPALWDAITWLEESGKSRLLQKPTIIVTNGKESVIDLTQDYIKEVESEITQAQSGQTSIPIVTRDYTIGSEQGIKIGITPFISPDGYVTMNISSNYSTPYQNVYGKDESGENVILATLLERRNLSLNSIRVRDGETIVLGGLIYESESQDVKKVPILGDIPGIGVFFRNTSSKKDKNELVVIITPRIVIDTEDIEDM